MIWGLHSRNCFHLETTQAFRHESTMSELFLLYTIIRSNYRADHDCRGVGLGYFSNSDGILHYIMYHVIDPSLLNIPLHKPSTVVSFVVSTI